MSEALHVSAWPSRMEAAGTQTGAVFRLRVEARERGNARWFIGRQVRTRRL